jgi:TRAP-type C4-dicarboxylate transport system substrate-binding protein
VKKALSILSFGFILVQSGFAQEYTVKFSTLAPEGSSWMVVMREYDAAVRKESGGRIGFKMYPGGIQGGDEKSMLRKIRIGQLQSGGFTGVGLGEIAPKVRILDSPFLVKNHAEMDFLYEKFGKEFEEAFAAGGFVFLGWAEVGDVNVFTNTPIQSPDDLKGIKMWTWEGDPVAQAAFQALHVHPIPLSIDNVLTSLQTGMIDAFYCSPYAATVLQWYTRAKYMVDYPLAISVGAVLISKKYFDSLPQDLQEILVRNGRTYMAKLTRTNREDNRKAIEAMQERGIIVTHADPKDIAWYSKIGAEARQMLVGRLYSEDLVKRVDAALAEFRQHEKGSR